MRRTVQFFTASGTFTDGSIRVLTAADGNEGLAVFRDHADQIHAVVLDLPQAVEVAGAGHTVPGDQPESFVKRSSSPKRSG